MAAPSSSSPLVGGADEDASSPRDAGDVRLVFVRAWTDFPESNPPDTVTSFLHRSLGRFGDDPAYIARGVSDALSPDPPGRGFVLLALDGDRLVGALVMLRTGMKGYVPENLLLYVAVDPDERGRGVGSRLCREAAAACDGEVKLHVEYDNPAKRLYERLGFKNKYAEMRLSP
jgi:ribosomal protein S18 acetylase RimI-like enzyme